MAQSIEDTVSFEDIRKQDSEFNKRLWGLNQLASDRAYYRNKIEIINEYIRLYRKQGKSNFAEVLYKELIGICDYYAGYDDYNIHKTSDEEKGDFLEYSSMGYIYGLKQMYIDTKKHKKLEFMSEYMLERYAKFHKSADYFMSSDEEKRIYQKKYLTRDLDMFSILTLKYQDYYPYLVEKLYNYQLYFKGDILLSEIKMRRKTSTHKNPEIRKLYSDFKQVEDSIVVEKKNGTELTERFNKMKAVLFYISETDNDNVNYTGSIDFLPDYARVYSKDTTQITWKNIREKLKFNEASVEIVRFKKNTNAFYTKKDTISLKNSDTLAYMALIITKDCQRPYLLDLEGNTFEERDLIHYKKAIFLKIKDEKSYNVFWKKIAEYLHKKKVNKVYISATKVYHSINLNTLYNPQTQKYVRDEFEIQMLTNSQEILSSK